MRSVQSICRLMCNKQANSKFTTITLQNQYLIAQGFSQQKEQNLDEQQSNDFNINSLVEDSSEALRIKVVQKYNEISEGLKKQQSKLDEKINQINNLDRIVNDQNKKLKELRNNLQIQAEDIQLTRTRLEKDKEQLKIYAISGFAKELLEVQDNLERAIQANQDKFQGKDDSLYDGVSITVRILDKILKKNGVVEIDCLNKKFDPNLAEALVQVDDPDKEGGTVAFVAQKGYMIHDRVLRAAKVGIVRYD